MSWLADCSELVGSRALVVTPGEDRLACELAERFEAVEAIAPEAAGTLGPLACFDMVAVAGALHRLASPTRVLYALKAALRPGGIFMIAEPIRVYQGTAQDLTLEAIQLWARLERARGRAVYDVFERLQVGSVIQGLGLEAIAFHPRLEAEGAWEAAELWSSRLEALAADQALAPVDRERARELALSFRAEGMRPPPMMVTYGRLPVPSPGTGEG